MKEVFFVIGSLSSGGAERVISILGNAFDDYLYKVTIILLYNNKIDYQLNNNINIKYIDVDNFPKILKFIKRILILRKCFKKNDSAIIISFLSIINIYSFIAHFGLKNILIVSERNDPNQVPESLMIRKIRNYIYKYVDALVCQTENAKDYFAKPIQDKTVIIMNPINDKILNVSKNVNKDKKIISVVRLEQQKRVDMLINSFNNISNVYSHYKLIICGEGTCKKYLKKLVREYHLEEKVIFKGFVTNVWEEMVTSELFVICSNYEGISNSLLEAMLLGLPVISTDSPIGGARGLIKDKINGLLIPVNDENALTDAIIYMLDNDDKRISMGKEAEKIIEIFNKDNIIKKWINLIEKLRGDINCL